MSDAIIQLSTSNAPEISKEIAEQYLKILSFSLTVDFNALSAVLVLLPSLNPCWFSSKKLFYSSIAQCGISSQNSGFILERDTLYF